MSWGLAVTAIIAGGTALASGQQSSKANKKAAAAQRKSTQDVNRYLGKVTKSAKGQKLPAAPQVNYLQTGRDALTLAREATPAMLDLEKRYGADYARTEVGTAAARNQAEQAVINQQGLGMRSALLGASPEIAAANDAVVRGLGETGSSEIEDELKSQALADLRLGGKLSNEDTRAAVQAARAGSSARGMANGQGGLIAELLGRQAFSDARKAERRNFAAGVDAGSVARRATDSSISNAGFGALSSFWDPQRRIFGQGGSQTSGKTGISDTYNSYLGAALDVAKGNQQAATLNQQLRQEAGQFNANRFDSLFLSGINSNSSAANAAANRSNAQAGALMGAAGQVGSAAMTAYLK